MTKRRWLMLALAVLVFLPSTVMSGCCLTSRVWESARDQPVSLDAVSLDANRVLHLAVRYESGEVWHVTAALTPDDEWTRPTAQRIALLQNGLPPSAYVMTNRPGREPKAGEVDVHRMFSRDKSGGVSHTVWVDGAGCQCVIELPAPLDWSESAPYVALLISPVTLVVDFVTAPMWVAWVFFTVGGHGDCWLPWCD